ncbi:LysR substrate-binding domain-containing protein [Falsirhodobacter deserti]|uniref:LysR substrate-binding domain-containing protein n=1 Tax=Falsirhodobacter deserti TaxID=1365611 RepID=UPI000FE36380|nr:LysR substrate-binding domain-containing protein [Falsirhodobacter deserti]
MELKWLEDFVTLAGTASFSRAARERNVTQSAFSRRIKQLEAWLGTTLINRASLPAELTSEGKALLPIAHETIRTFYGLRERLNPDDCNGRLTFAALHTLAVTLLPAWLQQVQTALPDLETAVIPDRGGIEANLDALINGEADLFLTYHHPHVQLLLDPQQYDWLDLGAERLLPVAAPHLCEKLGHNGPEGLIERAIRLRQTLPYLDYGQSSFFGMALRRVFEGAPLRRKTVHQNTISAGLRECALAGWGVCWLPERLVRQDMEEGRLILATASPEWILPLGIRLYRSQQEDRAVLSRLWALARTSGPIG